MMKKKVNGNWDIIKNRHSEDGKDFTQLNFNSLRELIFITTLLP